MFEEPDGATPLGPDEIHGLKFKHITTRGELDELEQANIQQGLLWLSGRRRGDICDDQFIRNLHRRLFGDVWDWAGTFRQREMNIGIEPPAISVQLRALLGNAKFWAEEKVFPPLEAAARFHHRMVEIHPFPNGNGRHARIAADLYLKDYFDHPRIDWEGGVDLQVNNERRNAYIAALRHADAGEFNAMLVFVGADNQPE
ncbi:mobile mystery protein B [Ahrensia sp. 13_GOM-1096m]|uniref:mobile mystery protein B n=1 Tax=Ahrensia sp. 13_GOM-1096m TaxID=1380380 RepID=UPI0005505966|nr:mobile mystery protein B [Ahrensia sp. 13_GOM-1096m]